MNRNKLTLLAATALTMLGTAGQANAQSVATGVTILSGPATPTANGEIGPDSIIIPNAISADGKIALAQVIPAGNVGTPINNNIWVWENGTPRMIAITRPSVPGVEEARQFTPTDLSGDGRTITGALTSRANLLDGTTLRTYTVNRAAYWTQASGLTLFPQVSAAEFVGRVGTAESAFVNSDGRFFAVTSSPIPYLADGSRNPAPRISRVHRYSSAGGYEHLGSLGSTVSMTVSGINGAGDVIIGNSNDIAASNLDANGDSINLGAFRWDVLSGLTQLSVLSAAPQNSALGRYARALDISRDGTTVVGSSRGNDGRIQAVHWRGSGIQALGFVPGFDTANATTLATATSRNGSIIGGDGTGGPWLWEAATGMQRLQTLVQNAGITLNGYTFANLSDISDTGEFIAGFATNPAGGLDSFGDPLIARGFVLQIARTAPPPAPVPVVTFLTAPTGSETPDASVVDISANGSIVAGGFGNAGIILWNNANPTAVANANGVVSSAISGDGNIVVGELFDATRLSVIYRKGTNTISDLPDVNANEIAVYSPAVNTDGTYFAVTSAVLNPASNCGSAYNGRTYICATSNRAYRWSPTGGYQILGTFGVQWDMFVGDISGDGQKIAVVGVNREVPFFQAAGLWTQGTGLVRLPDLSLSPTNGITSLLTHSRAFGISRDGSTVVGQSRGGNGLVQAVYWRGGTVTGLGFLSGCSPTSPFESSDCVTSALAANADGSVIVGRSLLAANNGNDLAWRWTAASGMQDLNLFATNAGINLGGYVLTDAVGLSDDGQYIAGNANNGTQQRGYVLSIAAGPPPPTTLSTTARLIVTLTLPGVTQTSIVNQSFSTQVDALLNGTNVFTRTVADQITGSLGVTALADARTALQVGSGLRRVVIGAPTLVSNTTTVLSSTSNTVNVASGTQVTTAAVVTNGPATVATGDLGTCATAATNGVNPTGCSLSGTPVSVDTNVINTTTFTNTINSVTPTTTQTVNQLISAKWQVSATAGNQFGTVHALVGPVSFERADQFVGQLTSPKRRRTLVSLDDVQASLFGSYSGGRSKIEADAKIPVAATKGSHDTFTIGGARKINTHLALGAAFDHGTSDYHVQDPQYGENLELKQTQVGVFGGFSRGQATISGALSYGFGTVDTVLETPTGPARASRDTQSWTFGVEGAYDVPLGSSANLALIGGARTTRAKLQAFTETGGSSPLRGLGNDVDRTRLYTGFDLSGQFKAGTVKLEPSLYARAAQDSGDKNGVADVVFASTPGGPTLQALGPNVGKSIVEYGAALSAQLSTNSRLTIGYDATTRDRATSSAARLGLSVAW
jgi:uncharacterized membrane protein